MKRELSQCYKYYAIVVISEKVYVPILIWNLGCILVRMVGNQKREYNKRMGMHLDSC